MTYDFSTRLDRLGTRMKQLHDNSLTYSRGATTTRIDNFTPEDVDVSTLAAYGLVLLTDKEQDFVFDYADLASFSPNTPQVGDRIVWGSRRYQVISLGSQDVAEIWRFITSTRKRIRVHTREVPNT